jgi:hypothetical protein
MQQINDIVKQHSLNPTTLNNDTVLVKKDFKPEIRSDAENEAFAARIAEQLGAGHNLKPYLAVAYSGIPQQTIERLAGLAKENGDYPAKLFMFFIKREPLWLEYQKRREDRKLARQYET